MDAAAFIALEYRHGQNADPGRCTAREAAMFLHAAAADRASPGRAPDAGAAGLPERGRIAIACVVAVTATLAVAAFTAVATVAAATAGEPVAAASCTSTVDSADQAGGTPST